MCSACRLMVFHVCVKFHENMSSGFKVTEQTRKLLTTHTHTHREKTKTIYPHGILCMPGGIIILNIPSYMELCLCHRKEIPNSAVKTQNIWTGKSERTVETHI